MEEKLKKEVLTVRELKQADVSLIVDYWLESDASFMKSMGVDLDKLPQRQPFSEMLKKQIELPNESKNAFALLWEINGKAIGHSNLNPIKYGKEATMHLHIWYEELRNEGFGKRFIPLSLPYYFRLFQLEKLVCEPFSENDAPNRLLDSLGFQFIKKYTTTPGSINFEQSVNRWELSASDFEAMNRE